MTDINELVEAAQSEEVFDFAEVVQGRGYPRDEVSVYLDEATAYKIQVLEEESSKERDPERVDELAEQIAELRAELDKSKYVFKIVGISTDTQEDLVDKARAEYPVEYENRRNPFTQMIERTEKADPEKDAARDRYFTNILWAAHIEQIVAPSGAVQTAPGPETVESLRKMPKSQITKLVQAFNKLEVASAAFEHATDEDFLAKS